MGNPPTFQFFFIIRPPSFEISIPSLPILRKTYRKILCTYKHVETPFCVMSRYQLGRDETTESGNDLTKESGPSPLSLSAFPMVLQGWRGGTWRPAAEGFFPVVRGEN